MSKAHHTHAGDPTAIVWPLDNPYAQMNEGFGCCNTGSGQPVICCLGGIGCNVDHVTQKQANERDAATASQTV